MTSFFPVSLVFPDKPESALGVILIRVHGCMHQITAHSPRSQRLKDMQRETQEAETPKSHGDEDMGLGSDSDTKESVEGLVPTLAVNEEGNEGVSPPKEEVAAVGERVSLQIPTKATVMPAHKPFQK